MIERIMIDLKLDYNWDYCMYYNGYGIVLYLHCIVFGLYCIYIQLYLYCIDLHWIIFIRIVLYLHLFIDSHHFVISLLNLSNVIYCNIIYCIICICRDWVCFIIVLIVYGSLYNTAMLRSPIYQLHPEI